MAIYTCITYRQWRAMLDSNKLTQQSLNVSQRAYITIGRKDGVIAEFIVPKDSNQNAVLVLYFQNSGHIPAKLAWGTFGPNFIAGPPGTHPSSGIITSGHPFRGMFRRKNKKTGAIGEQGESVPIAGDSIFVAPFGEISQRDLANLQANNAVPLMSGRYQYCDELGTDVQHMFGISYQNAPNAALSFKLVFDNENGFPLAPSASTGEWEDLPPCQTVSEREQEQKKAN